MAPPREHGSRTAAARGPAPAGSGQPASARAGPQPRRADARRNVAAILAAAVECLAVNPDTSMAEIAAAAGVGRMTLYGHFKTRAELLDAVLARVITGAHESLDALELSGDARDALARLTGASWRLVDQLRGILAAAQRELPAERIRQAHDPVLGKVRALVEQGRLTGAFRTDLPVSWLVSLAMNVMHAAAAEVSAGRLDGEAAPGVVTGTLLAAFTPPGAAVPAASG